MVVTRSYSEINADESVFPGIDGASSTLQQKADGTLEALGDLHLSDSEDDYDVADGKHDDHDGDGAHGDEGDDDDDMDDPGGEVLESDRDDVLARWNDEYNASMAEVVRAGAFEHHHIALMAERPNILTPVEDVSWNTLMRSVHCQRFVEAAVDEMKSHLRCETRS